jgi:AcrR family transcriptional regulator
MSPRSARALAGREGDAGVLLREHLLDTADRLLAQGDVATITARALARAADVSDGVLYNHFADKNDVLLTGDCTGATPAFLRFIDLTSKARGGPSNNK